MRVQVVLAARKNQDDNAIDIVFFAAKATNKRNLQMNMLIDYRLGLGVLSDCHAIQ
jgi:hypothetical protein